MAATAKNKRNKSKFQTWTPKQLAAANIEAFKNVVEANIALQKSCQKLMAENIMLKAKLKGKR